MRGASRVVVLTVSMVVLVGVLSAGAALWHTRNLISSYDELIRTELEHKALSYGQISSVFLDALGPDAFALAENLLLSTSDDTAIADSSDSSQFGNDLLGFEIWLPDSTAPNGYRLVDRQSVSDYQVPPNSEESALRLLAQTSDTGEVAAAIDEQAQLIRLALPISFDERTRAVGVVTLSAKDELAFFAKQRQAAIRNGILLSVAIVAVVSLVGVGLSYFVSRDLTERKRAEDALREQARRDPLTGTLNHAAIVDELRSLTAGADDGAPTAIAMADVDGMKATNDTYGHQVGDNVLVAVASTLSRGDAIVGRYGGDEFVVVLPGADRLAAQRYRDAVLSKLADTHLSDPESGARVPVVASIGLAVYPEETDTVHELIRLADSAMYASRRQRPGGVGGLSPARSLGGRRAAEIVGEIVPLLTSQGGLEDKLRLVTHRISVGAGYDAVDFSLFASEPGTPLAQNTFARGPEELLEAWNREQRDDSPEPHPIRLLFQRTPRPVILDDPWNDELLLEPQRAILRAAKLRSVLVAPMIWQDQVVGSLGVASRREAAFTSRDAQFLAAVATQVTAIVRMTMLVEELQSTSDRLAQAHTETVTMLAAAAEAHDHTTGLHLQSVRALSEALAGELGYSEDDLRELGLVAVLHDIGKIRVPESVLASAGELAGEEWELMRHHTTWGAEFLAGRPGFELAASIARSHHERWDGTGYPHGLSGDGIPEAATIVAVADSFDAITHDRPYRAGRPLAQAVEEIVAFSGKQFSPKVVAALTRLYQRGALPLPHTDAPDREAAA